MNFKEKIAQHLFGGSKNRFLLFAALIVLLVMFIYFPGTLVGTLGTVLNLQDINDMLFSGVFTFASYHDCVSNFGDGCTKSNACDTNVGSIQCYGTCSAAEPDPLPANYGNSCSSSNACNTTNGTYDCTGTCNAATPAPPPANYGNACTKSNACNSTSGTYDCTGTCNAATPADPPANYGNGCTKSNACDTNVGSIQCNGTCSASEPDPLPANYGNDCTKSNACNSTSGTYDCTGTCNAATPASPPANYGNACTKSNACNTTSGTYDCSGSCNAATPADPPANYGNGCTKSNACDSNVGFIQCDGTTCSASEPDPLPANYGNVCTKSNACNTTSGTYQCDGSCSAATPNDPPANYGNVCYSAPNACGQKNISSYDCTGSCPASTPPNPSSCTRCNNAEECSSGYECSGPGTCSATAPADRSFSVSASASPNQGTAPLNGVNITSDVGGTAIGDITYRLDCTNNGTWEQTVTNSTDPYTFSTRCDYPSPGSYTTKVQATRQTLTSNATTNVLAASVSLAANPSASSVEAGTTVTYTASSGFDVGSTVYYIRIYEGSSQQAVCGTGTTCSYSTSSISTTRTFTAKIENVNSSVVLATSNNVSTTWNKITTQLPDSDFYFDPTTIVQGNSTTVRGWLKTSSGTGIGGKMIDLQCWNGTSWPQVTSGTTETASPNTGYTSFSWAPTSSWNGAVSCRLNFAGDTNYLASTSGQKVITIVAPALSFPTTRWQRLWYNDPKTNNFSDASFLGEGPNQSSETFDDNWGNGTVAYSKGDKIGFRSSRTIDFTGREGTYFVSVGHDDGARLYIDGNLVINSWIDTGFLPSGYKIEMTSGPHTFLLEYYENTGDAHISFSLPFAACSKSSTVPDDTAFVTIPTATGTTQCTVTIKHAGQDLTDSSPVKYETTSTGSRSRKVEMDDAPTGSGSCNLDLLFYTEWNNPAAGFLTVLSEAQSKAAANDLSWDYTLETSGCVIVNASRNACLNDAQSVGENACNNPTIAADKKTATKKHGIKRNYSITDGNYVRSNFTLSLVECTQDSHCSADPNKAYCNVSGGTRNVSTFPQNTCVDSIAPTSVSSSESLFINSTDGSKAPGYRAGDDTYWLNTGAWFIPTSDTDSNSGVDTAKCTYTINDLGRTNDNTNDRTRTCDNILTVNVGPAGDCQTQGTRVCQLITKVTDKAGNSATSVAREFNIDYTPPNVQ